MCSSNDATFESPTFSERFGVYVIPKIDWNSYSHHTRVSMEELACKELDIWACFMALHLVLKGEDMRDYFVRKYEDLYSIYIRLEDELAYELDPNKVCIEWAKPTWLNCFFGKGCHHL